ncbi:MAG: amidohydrolase family protein [Burkholderiales bacterium]
MNRREFLHAAGISSLLAAGISGCDYSFEDGFFNPCLARLPKHITDNDFVKAAWSGIDAAKMWDSHAHLVGVGDSGSGAWVNPSMESLLNTKQYVQRLFYLNAGCTHEAKTRVDQSYIERLHNLLDGLRPGAKLLLFAFDYQYTETGDISRDHSTFYLPNEYAAKTAALYPQYFEWAASIHPYRKDCVEALEQAVKQRARAVKWLPAAQGMNPSSALCDKFFSALVRHKLPLITHAGEEKAVHGGDTQAYGNPLLLRRALDHGVRVVVAHCASLGQDRDLDLGANGPYVNSFELFARLMDDAKYGKTLHGDISAVTQLNRAIDVLKRIIERSDWHGRLLNGSDYPIPGVMPLYSIENMLQEKMITKPIAPVLREIRKHNPLLFDFVLKRHLQSNGKQLSARIFETRPFFESIT